MYVARPHLWPLIYAISADPTKCILCVSWRRDIAPLPSIGPACGSRRILAWTHSLESIEWVPICNLTRAMLLEKQEQELRKPEHEELEQRPADLDMSEASYDQQ